MKFWKLKMNDRNYLLVSVRREHMRDVTLCSEQMQQEHQSFAGSIVREDIRFQIVEDANTANLTVCFMKWTESTSDATYRGKVSGI